METVYASHCREEGSSGGPRERIALNGAAREADLDLLKALLGSGSRGHHVETIALSLLHYFDHASDHAGADPNYADLVGLPGMGCAKAAQIVAAWEFCRRRMRPAAAAVRSPEELLPLIRHYGDRPQEHFLSVPLKRRSRGNRDLRRFDRARKQDPGPPEGGISSGP